MHMMKVLLIFRNILRKTLFDGHIDKSIKINIIILEVTLSSLIYLIILGNLRH